MPPYAFLAKKDLDYRDIADKLRAQRTVGVPYSDAMIANAVTDLETQADPFASGGTALKTRYGAKINQRDFDGQPDKISDMDALIAYLQMLGTTVDFTTYKADAGENLR
jgi:cytochrome c oxidase cbb3-type subunit 2